MNKQEREKTRIEGLKDRLRSMYGTNPRIDWLPRAQTGEHGLVTAICRTSRHWSSVTHYWLRGTRLHLDEIFNLLGV